MKLFFVFSCAAIMAVAPTVAFVTPSTDPHRVITPPSIHHAQYNRNGKSGGDGSVHKPPVLDGTFAGDYGFDPLGFVQTKDDLIWYREAEMKHARLAMLAAVGWPLSELWDRNIANYFGLQPAVDAAERAPSVFNGGLDRVVPGYWAFCFFLGAAVEYHIYRVKNKPGYFPGNLGFDPLRLYPSNDAGQRRMELAEIRNGRLAMLAVVSYALQERIFHAGVVELTPWLFKPIWTWGSL